MGTVALLHLSLIHLLTQLADTGYPGPPLQLPPPPPPPQGYSTDIECYERVAVGKKLNDSQVSSSLPSQTVRHCEQECERAKCLAFSFGISHSGNGTCQLATKMPQPENTISDIEYDLFYKNIACIQRISCYKRMAVGRSLIDRLVRRSMLCDSLRACEEACQGERDFQCEGFNFKFDPNGVDNKCQLTDVKSHKLDLTRDFNPDVDFDFYDRDLNGPRQCFRGPEFDAARPGGGLPPSGGYPGSGPGDPGYPGLGEEPPGGPARPPLHPPPPPPLHPPRGYPDQGGRYPEPGNALVPAGAAPGHPGRHEYGGGGAYPLGGSRGGLPDECFLRSRSGFRLDRRIVLVSLTVPSLYDCESMCVSERKFKCNTFSFRYSVNPAVPNHNCHLAEKPYVELDLYQDLQPDRDFDIYERNPTGIQGCQPKKSYGSECFERVRSGLKLNKNMVKFASKCSSLKECEYACLSMPFFTCRAFSFRYGPPMIGEGDENCLLTDWPVPEMNAGQHLSEDPDCELYHRGSYGHGCEVDRFPSPPLPDRPGATYPGGPGAIYPSGPGANSPGGPGGPQYPVTPGYPGRDRPGYPGEGYQRPLPRPDYGYPGNEIHKYNPPNKPQGYSPEKPSGYLPPLRPPPTSNYLPPDRPGTPYPTGQGNYPVFVLPPPRQPDRYLPPKDSASPTCCTPPPPGQDGYLPPKGPPPPPPLQGHPVHGSGGGYGGVAGDSTTPRNTYLPPSYDVARPQLSDQLCYVRYSSPARLLPKSIKNALWVPGETACKEECTRAREKTKFRCATLSYREGQCELSDVEQRDLRPGYDYLHDEDDFWLFTWDFGAPGCHVPHPPPRGPLLSNPAYIGNRGVDDTWSRFTVNGQPCIAGTVCSPNKETGVWTCPVGSGDWDYCCRGGHQCGYSEGYDYPWCYVGDASKEQWRPCSDTYLPYPHSGRKTHWPVAYLHRETPPNVTLSHKPSIVESFLKSLEKSGFGTTLSGPEGKSSTNGTTASTDKEGAMDMFLKWGKTAMMNLTSTMAPGTNGTSTGTTELGTTLVTTVALPTTTTPAQSSTTKLPSNSSTTT